MTTMPHFYRIGQYHALNLDQIAYWHDSVADERLMITFVGDTPKVGYVGMDRLEALSLLEQFTVSPVPTPTTEGR